MKRLAVYAHFGESAKVARYVSYFLKELRSLGFEICFVSNSPISIESQSEISTLSQKFIQRENTGYDFSMWQAGLAEYDLSKVEELLLTNSSIVGPLQPLAPLWQNSSVKQCDFWSSFADLLHGISATGDSRRVFHGFLAFSPATQGQTAGDSKLRNWPDPPAGRKWVQMEGGFRPKAHVVIVLETPQLREENWGLVL